MAGCRDVETKRRTVRVPDDVWARAGHVAAERGTTISERVVDWLDRFGREPHACVCCSGTISDDGSCGDCGC